MTTKISFKPRIKQLLIATFMLCSLSVTAAPVVSAVNDPNTSGGGSAQSSSGNSTKCDHGSVSAKSFCYQCPNGSTADTAGNCPNIGNVCGSGDSATPVSIDIGCKGKGNSITDATFAIIRFLTNGVGVVLVGSMVFAGIQYTSSKGDPNATSQAINRIRANVFALLLFVFAYAILNYIIPGQVFKT